MLSKISLRQIRYFLAVARHGNFTGAARELSVSQPALGQQVKQLEEVLACALFIRHARGVVLTDSGRLLQGQATMAVDLLDSAAKRLTRLGPKHNTMVSLGVTTTAGKALVGKLISSALKHDGKTLRFSFIEGMSDQLIAEVESGEIDAAIAYDVPAAGHIGKIPLFQESFVLIGNKKLLYNEVYLDIRRLSEFPLIVGPAGQPYRNHLDSIAHKFNTKINVGAELGSLSLKQEMLRHGYFIIAPYGRFLSEDDGDLMAVDFSPPIIRTMYLCFRSDLPRSLQSMLSELIAIAVETSIQDGSLVRVVRTPGRRIRDVARGSIASVPEQGLKRKASGRDGSR